MAAQGISESDIQVGLGFEDWHAMDGSFMRVPEVVEETFVH